MYQVVKMQAEFEPWWFFEDWQKNITESADFIQFDEALVCFKEEWQRLYQKLPCYQSRQTLLAAFWSSKEQYWCEECADYLQNYHSLLLLEDWEIVSQKHYIACFEQQKGLVSFSG
ncbi:DUF1033 family protein [Streptococcus pantholopis]|uniref:Dipicolinate synthase n=1 Tax=Streptococcus pantholopis TaxID=1811193 RepID=A0A172QA64_9STRE|nr:DUF1033 family protein [Streptococcus pantholopis]AND80340.1 dipicolinate synthase [Streptococcus pantholopis]